MNNQDRERLQRLHRLLSVPFANIRGGKTASALGALQYTSDMMEILPAVKSIMRQMAVGETYEGCIDEDLAKAEEFFRRREQDQWGERQFNLEQKARMAQQ